MAWIRPVSALGIAMIAAACSPEKGGRATNTSGQGTRMPPGQPVPTGAASGSSVSAAIPAEDGQWTMPAKDYASTRFSGLSEITTANVKNLHVAWTFSTSVLRGHEEAPLVVGNTMYIVTPFPNHLYALDLTKPGAPMKWVFRPKPASTSQGVACCDVVNRGVVYADGKLFMNTLDAHTIAVDANSGAELWRTKVGDINIGETVTMAPLVVKGKVLVGNSGGEMGVRGWTKALDAASGRIVWTAYHTGPDSEVLIGPNFKPFYPQDQGKNLGISTWVGEQWKIGGGTQWGWISYDPDLDLIYYGTGNPGPWNDAQRPGDNKWTNTVFARKPETGEAVWAYQVTPHDLYDYDEINESLLLEMPVNGARKKVIVRPGRDGYVYVMDRATGQVYSATPFDYVTTSTGVDLKTGRIQYNDAVRPRLGDVVRGMCPAAPGAKDWQPSAFSPRTGLIYLPHQHICMDFEGVEASYIAGTPYVGANVKMYAGPGGYRGEFCAWDPVTGKKVWAIQEKFPVWSGTVVTAGDVAFYGTMDGWFKAVDARNGQPLWQFKVGSGIISQPMTFRGPDGKQYVAVVDGVGGWAGAVVVGNIDVRDSLAALGFTNAMKDLPQATTKGGTVYVFSL